MTLTVALTDTAVTLVFGREPRMGPVPRSAGSRPRESGLVSDLDGYVAPGVHAPAVCHARRGKGARVTAPCAHAREDEPARDRHRRRLRKVRAPGAQLAVAVVPPAVCRAPDRNPADVGAADANARELQAPATANGVVLHGCA